MMTFIVQFKARRGAVLETCTFQVSKACGEKHLLAFLRNRGNVSIKIIG